MKRIKAGRLRHRVDIERLTTARNEYGETVETWVDLAESVPVAVEPLSVRERLVADQAESRVTTRMVMRYRDIKASDRIKHKGLTFEVVGVMDDPISGAEWLTVMCYARD